MKNKILIGSKHILSLLIALSLLAVSLFTADINLTANAVTGTTDTWDGSYTEPTDEDDDGIITISTAAELAWAILKSGTAGAGMTYKVADGITAFYMNENTADLTLEQVENELDGNNTNAWEYQGNIFQATLDGNGVTIYGLYIPSTATSGNDNGFIPQATGNVTVKNIAIKNSYICGFRYVGAIVGLTDSSLTSLTIEQCMVNNTYIAQTRTKASSSGLNYSAGALCGYVDATHIPCRIDINNCLVYGNKLSSALNGNISGSIAYFNPKSDNCTNGYLSFKNLVIIGEAPWCGNYSYYGRKIDNFSNVYSDTDASGFTKNANTFNSTYLTDDTVTAQGYCTTSNGQIDIIDTDNMQGTAAQTNMDLSWDDGKWVVNESGFPSLAVFSTNDSDDGSGDGEDGGSTDGGDGDNTDGGDDTTVTVSDTWDGTFASSFESGTGTKTDPFIIKTAEQLAYLASGAGGTTGGNYYKVADGIEAFDMNGFVGITLSSTLDDVKKAEKTDNNWSATYQSTNANAFCGSFDGNGLIVYNLYGQGSAMGLFPCIKGSDSVEIKNVTVKNSYFEATDSGYGYGAGAIFGRHTNTDRNYPITIEKCVVDSCYIANTNTFAESYAGAIGGTVRWSNAVINNCRVSDNELSSGTVSEGGLIAAAQGSSAITATNCVVIGTMPYPSGTLSATDTNFTDLVAASSYLNIYTDQTVDSTYTGITTLTTTQMTGDTAIANMTALDWGSNWKAQESDYPIPFTYTVPEGVWNGEVAAEYSGGDGSEATPFIIENAAQLYKMVMDCGEDANGNAAYFKVKDGVYDIYCNPVEDMTADEIRTYFESNATYKSTWNPQTTEFNGSFDGNGVTIHGLYNVGSSTAGISFLPRVSNSTAVIENVEFNGCYFKNTSDFSYWSCASVVVGRASDSTVTLKNIAVVDSTAISTNAYAGILLGVTVADATIDTAFTSGNIVNAGYTITLSGVSYPYAGIIYGNCFSGNYDPTMAMNVKNSVFTETDYQLTSIGYKIGGASGFAVFDMYVAGKTVESITGIDNPVLAQEDMQGTAAKENMPDLDWTKWIVSDSYPIIAALHDLEYTIDSENKDSGHSASCNDCDITVPLESHTYDSNYVCVLCGFEHSHTLVDNGIDYDATCVDSGVMNVKCEYCDYTSTREICAKKHKFDDIIAATAGNCKTEATVSHKICSVCELAFNPDAADNSNEPLDHIGTGYTACHDWVGCGVLTSECGGVNSISYAKCSICSVYLVEGVMTKTEPSKMDGHTASGNYYIDEEKHANICVTCGETFGETEHVDADSDDICDVCSWHCGENLFGGASVTLKNNIAVNYMITKSTITTLGYEELCIEFIFCGKNYTVTNYTETTIDDVEYYVFTFDTMAPDRMADTIDAALHGKKGDATYTSMTSGYSVKKYCHNLLEESTEKDAELRTLLVDFLNYGAAAQSYTDYNTDSLANASLTEEQAAWGTQENRELVSVQNLALETVSNPTVIWKGGGLHLDETTTLRFTIQTDNIENLTVKGTCGTTAIEIPASEFVKRTDAEKRYYIYIRGLSVTQMSDEVTLTVYDGETAVSNTICYSVESYAEAKIGKDTEDTALSDLLVAMIKYGDSAKKYVA